MHLKIHTLLNNILISILLMILVYLLFWGIADAQPAGNRAVEDAYVDPLGRCSQVTIDFAFPVQYLSHFPEKTGSELRVQLRPLAVGSTNVGALIFNESIRIVDDLDIELTRFEYISDRYPEDPYLWLVSDEEFHFQVEQGGDFRSLVLILSRNPIQNCN